MSDVGVNSASNEHQGPEDSDSFVIEVQRLRSEYDTLRDNHNLFGPSAKDIVDIDIERVAGRDTEIIWLEDGTPAHKCVRLVDRPGTLSGEILRLRRNLPDSKTSFEIDGDAIHVIEPQPLPVRDDDTEDITAALEILPVIEVDPSIHHLKKGKYRSEIETLLRCQGGHCPGEPISPHIIQLLGKSVNGELVFPKLRPRYFVFPFFCSISVYKQWIQDLITALKALHSLGIVHRDVSPENILFTADGQRLILADLECRWGRRFAPEIACDDGIDSGWTEKSDIYDIGMCIQSMIYANIPITAQVEWPVPAPFDKLVEACMRSLPEERPTLAELKEMLDKICV